MFEDIYFIYIFNSENMSIMSDHCYMKTMPCIFFDPKKEIFVDSKEEKVVLEKNEIGKGGRDAGIVLWEGGDNLKQCA